MSLWRRLQYLSPSYRRAAEREMQEEMESLAEIAGRPELGNLTLAAENARATWGWTWLDGIFGDLKYAFRTLSRQPSFATVAVLSLALGIGANAAIFSLMDALLWRSLPVHEPQNLVRYANGSRSYFGYTRFAEGSGSVMESVFASTSFARMLDSGGGEHRGSVHMVSGNYFQALGVPATLGRTLSPDDDRRESPSRVAVLGHDYWLQAFAGSRDAVGLTLRVDKATYTIVGVAPAEFYGINLGEVPDIWVPITTLPDAMPISARWLNQKNANILDIYGRLKPGITLSRAAQELSQLRNQIDLERNGPPDSEAELRKLFRGRLKLAPASQGVSFISDRFSKPLRVIFWMVGIGLLLACVNVMSLQFARADERRRELTVRLAIGASRFRIARQLLAESLVIAAAGGAFGLALFHPVATGMASLISMGDEPMRLVMPISHTLLLFVTAISVAAALVSGVAPALRATRGEVMPGLQQGARGTNASPLRQVLGRSVAVVQMALSLVLVAATCLFAYNLHRLRQFDSGVSRDRLLLIDVDPAEAGYKDAALIQLNVRLRDRLAAIPGIAAVSFSQNGLYSGRNYNGNIDADGFPANAPGDHNFTYDHVGPNFFTTAGAHMIAGRDFNPGDSAGAPGVAILTKSMAHKIFADRNPVGLDLYVPTGPAKEEAYRIVGVVNDIRTDVHEPQLMYYLCQLQSQAQAFSTRFLVRTADNGSAVAAGIRAAVKEVDRQLRVSDISSADELFDRTVDRDRLLATLAWGFGLLALTLAAVGIYGLLSFDVTRRTGEIGIRMAVGARKGDIMSLILREVAIVCGIGLVIGILAAAQLTRLVEGMVFGFTAGDPRVLAAAALVLVATALLAAAIPARRAAAMDPMRALRCE